MAIPAGVDPEAIVRCPLCDAEYALTEAIALAPPELIRVVPADRRVRETHQETAAEECRVRETHQGPADGAFHAPYETPDIHEPNEAAAVAEPLPASSVAAQLRGRPRKSVLRRVVGIILGGLPGCLMAYYGLAWYFGADFDKHFPKLPLPFIQRLTAPPAGAGHPIEKPPENPADS